MAVDLASQIAKELSQYTQEVEDLLQNAAEEITSKAVTTLEQTSPKLTGDYAKGWRTKKVKGKIIVHNATDWQLTHLLENGHLNRKGGRTAPVVHIRPVEQQAIQDFTNHIEEALS